jgi:dienelactone hydrolase
VAEGRVRADSFDGYLIPLQDEAYAEAASIAVEHINGPVLLITGQDDMLWPSTELTEFAVRRFRAKNFPHRVEHLSYPGTGHHIGWPNAVATMTRFAHPVSGEACDLGGSPEATAHARRDSWPRMLSFLRNSLAPQPGA